MAKKAKKRGVKPGTKRGPYKKAKRVPSKYRKLEAQTSIPVAQWEAMNKAMSLDDFSKKILEPSVAKFKTAHPEIVGNLPSLISDLTSTIDTLEAQLTAQIDRIKSILV